MRLGLIARADDRGLGTQTLEFYRHLRPERTLVVDMSHNSPYAMHRERFPGATVVPFHGLSDDTVGPFLAGLAVVLTAETPYWWGKPYDQPGRGLYGLAHDLGVKTVCQVNPEFFVYAIRPDLPQPDLLIAPTTWRLTEMQEVAEVRHLPFPVDRARLRFRRREKVETLLHIVGHRAIHDRNGTLAFLHALRLIRGSAHVLIRSQSPLPRMGRLPPRLDVEVRVEDIDDYSRLYDEGDVLVLPRRFGGQSLVMNEALSTGMGLITTDLAPQRSWVPTEALVPVRSARSFRSQGGTIPLADPSPRALAQCLDRLLVDPEMIQRLSDAADRYAETISWDVLLPRYLATFDEVLNR